MLTSNQGTVCQSPNCNLQKRFVIFEIDDRNVVREVQLCSKHGESRVSGLLNYQMIESRECNYRLVSVVFDLSSQFPLLVLQAEGCPTTIGIRVGLAESTLIIHQLQYGGKGKRLLFSAMAGTISALGGALREIEIHHFDSTAFILSARANIILSHSVVHVDMRCSDGIGLAVATGAPIFWPRDALAQYLQYVQNEGWSTGGVSATDSGSEHHS